MSHKPGDTDPNFPPAMKDSVSAMLDDFRKPHGLHMKATARETAGQDAVAYQTEAQRPPARANHATVPNARVIIEATPVPELVLLTPETGGLDVTPEERARMESMFRDRAKTSKKDQPAARKSDPTPPVQTEVRPPTRRGLRWALPLLALFLCLAVAVGVGVRMVSSAKTAASTPTAPTSEATLAPPPTAPASSTIDAPQWPMTPVTATPTRAPSTAAALTPSVTHASPSATSSEARVHEAPPSTPSAAAQPALPSLMTGHE